ncbi:Glycosyl phosphatidyl inositol protein transamidase complex subunit [Cryptotrichosporon argae]
MSTSARLPTPMPTVPRVRYTPEQTSLAKKVARRRRVLGRIWARLPAVRAALVVASIAWTLALPYSGLWKGTRVDEHALQPGQVTMYYDWSNVHAADTYLGHLERLPNATFDAARSFLETSFARSGLTTRSTARSLSAHVAPPRASGLETILLLAPMASRSGGPNLRGVALLLSLADMLRGQTHWAADFVLVVADGHADGVAEFAAAYSDLYPGNVWTALVLDYPGHSFDWLGIYYEGTNGRLPNQDAINTVAHVARYSIGVDTRLHDLDASAPEWASWGQAVQDYVVGARHLWAHAQFAALGKPSAAHGLLSQHRVDALTLFAHPSTGPHGFHSLGRLVESTLRSYNNLLERLHASFFFYLLPRPHAFMPVGHYLPIAVLLGASLTLGGLDCPDPLAGLVAVLPALLVAAAAWATQWPVLTLATLAVPKSKTAASSARALGMLLFGAIVPSLAMVNFPQALALGLIAVVHFEVSTRMRHALVLLNPALWGLGLRETWEVAGGLAWPGSMVLWPILYISSQQ